MEQLTATVLDTTFRNDDNGYTVLRVAVGRGQHTVVGSLPALSAGENVTFQGDWTEHPVYGRQFAAKTCEITPPDSLSAVEKYLGSGLIRGIGPTTAKLIVNRFGMDAMAVLDEHPERLTEVSGIGPKKAAMILESYQEQVSMRRAMLFLQNYGIGPNLSTKIAKTYGEATVEMIRENPYRLVTDIEGVGFLTADRIALSMGIDPHSEFRVRTALYYLLTEAATSGGHTYLPRPLLISRAVQMLRVDESLVETQVTQALLTKMLVSFRLPGQEEDGLCLPFYFNAESEIAMRLAYLMEARPYKKVEGFSKRMAEMEKELGIRLSTMQRKPVRSAVDEGVLIITGGPGTGKTTIIRCISGC
jgi:exodeoxyribonuclease V alpha subunit